MAAAGPRKQAPPRTGNATRDAVLAHALAKPGAWLDRPFGPESLAAKVDERIFVITGEVQDPPGASLRNEPDGVAHWRERYPEHIGPAPYMGAKPWNFVRFDGPVPRDELFEMVDESYDSVVRRLPVSRRPPGWDPTAGSIA